MEMTSRAMIKNPEKIVCKMEFEMSLADWRTVSGTLRDKGCYANLQVAREIDDLVYQLEKTLMPSVKAHES